MVVDAKIINITNIYYTTKWAMIMAHNGACNIIAIVMIKGPWARGRRPVQALPKGRYAGCSMQQLAQWAIGPWAWLRCQ